MDELLKSSGAAASTDMGIVLLILFIGIFVIWLAGKYIKSRSKNRIMENQTAAPGGISAETVAAITAAVNEYRKK